MDWINQNVTHIARMVAMFVLCCNTISAHAQESNGTESRARSPAQADFTSNKPDYLKPVSETADLNLLGMILGDVARAAAGQIDLANVLMAGGTSNENDSITPEDTDSVLSAVMFVYNMGVLGASGFLIFVIVLIMALQAGIDGKVFSQRYSEWAAIRAIYAALAMMPIIGGWSIGQYGILNLTFIVNSVTNEMHRVSNRWIYSRNTVFSLPLQSHEYRNLVESIYLSELCAAVANNYYDEKIVDYQRKVAELEERMKDPSITTFIEAKIQETLMALEIRFNDNPVDYYQIQPAMEKEYANEAKIQAFGALGPNLATWDGAHHYVRQWGGKSSAPDSCGKVEYHLNVGLGLPQFEEGSDMGGGKLDMGPRNKAFVKAHFDAHVAALEATYEKARKDIAEVNGVIQDILEAAPDFHQRIELIKEAEKNHPLIPVFAGLIEQGFVTQQTYFDTYLAARVSEYAATVTNTYNDQTRMNLAYFEAQLNELERRMRDGAMADYRKTWQDRAGSSGVGYDQQETFHPLIENTQKGWVYTGYKWWDLSRVAAFQLELMQQRPHFSSFASHLDDHPAEVGGENSDLAMMAAVLYEAKTKRTVTELENYYESLPAYDPELISTISQEYSDDLSGAIQQYKSKLGDWITQTLAATSFDFKNLDLLANLQNAGHNYLLIGEAALAGIGIAKIKSATDKRAGAFIKNTPLKHHRMGSPLAEIANLSGEITEAIAGVLTWVAIIFLIVGFIYAIYLPLLPGMIWTLGIISWLEKLIGLIIALPLWAAGHIIPEGDGLINSTSRTGYVLLTNVLARPPVMLLSIHFAIATLGAIGWMLQDFLSGFMPSANQGFTNGIVVGLGGFIVFSGFLLVIAHRIVGWIYQIADDLPMFFGGSSTPYGEGTGAGKLDTNVTGFMVSKIEGGAGNMIKSSGNNPNHSPRPPKQNTSNHQFAGGF